MSNKTIAVVLVCFCLFAAMAAGAAYLLQDLPPTHEAARATMVAASYANQPHFGPIAFCTGLREGLVEQGATFPSGTTEVYALWTYQDMADGTPYYLLWFHEDAQYREETLVWNTDAHGARGPAHFTSLVERDGGSLPPGNYRLALFIRDHQVQEATFEILEPEP